MPSRAGADIQGMLTIGWSRAARGLGALLVAGSVVAGLATPAHASAASDFVGKINAARPSGHALVVRADLQAAAQAQAERMADASNLFHNPNLGGSVHNWSALAENVGYGPDVATIHQAFMQSPDHRHNILNTAYREVGVGVVVRDHVMWVAEVFRQPTGHSSAAPKPPAKKPAAALHKAAKPQKANQAANSPASPTKKPVRSKAKPTKHPTASKEPAPTLTPSALHRATAAAAVRLGAADPAPLAARAEPRLAGSSDKTGGLPRPVSVTMALLALVVLGGAAHLRFRRAPASSGRGPKHAAG